MNSYRRVQVIKEYTERFARFVDALELSQKYPEDNRVTELARNLYKSVNNMTSHEKDFAGVARAIKKNPKAFGIPGLDTSGF